MIEKELRANWDNVFYPEPEPEVETFGEEVQSVDQPVLLAAGPSGTVSDGGAAFGVFPQMKPRRAGASEIGANLPLLAADVAAGTAKGVVSGVAGFPGDIAALGRGLYEIGKRGGNEGALDAFLRGLQEGTVLPTSDDVDKWLTKNIGPVVPPGGPLQGEREAAAGVGRLVGETVADPFVAIKGVKAAAKGAKALAPKAGEMLDAYMQRTGMQANLMAYHGTPHTVDKFDAAKIGTGEGAQAYGYGLYFAESKDVAGGYAVTLANRDMKNQGRLNAHANAQRLAALAGDPKFAADDLRFVLDSQPDHPQKQLLLDSLQMLESGDYKKPLKTTGNLYTVDVPDELIAKMLDFDAPISSQSQEVQALARQYNLQPEDLGGDLLAAVKGKTAAGAQLLRDAGIPGVRYLDQGGRGNQAQIRRVSVDGKTKFEVNPGWNAPNQLKFFDTMEQARAHADSFGSRNIVVFPGGEDQVKILKREGQNK